MVNQSSKIEFERFRKIAKKISEKRLSNLINGQLRDLADVRFKRSFPEVPTKGNQRRDRIYEYIFERAEALSGVSFPQTPDDGNASVPCYNLVKNWGGSSPEGSPDLAIAIYAYFHFSQDGMRGCADIIDQALFGKSFFEEHDIDPREIDPHYYNKFPHVVDEINDWQPSEITWPEDADFDFESEWLSPNWEGGIPFVGREEELQQLDEFAQDAGRFKVWAIIAPSGAGKTRLVNHWLRKSLPEEWRKCRLNSRAFSASAASGDNPWADWAPDRPTVLIIDYLYGFEETARQIMARGSALAKAGGGHPIRLLILDHVFPKDLAALHSESDWNLGQAGLRVGQIKSIWFGERQLELSKAADQNNLLRGIIARVAGLNVKNAAVEAAFEKLIEWHGAQHPLFAALIGNEIRLDHDIQTISNRRALIIAGTLGPERLCVKFDSENQAERLYSWASVVVGAATVRQGMPYEDAENAIAAFKSKTGQQLPPLVPHAAKVVSSWPEGELAPFTPDIIGETHCLELIKGCGEQDQPQRLFEALVATGNIEREPARAFALVSFGVRIIHNLANDDQQAPDTARYWRALDRVLDFESYPKGSAVRWAMQMAHLSAHERLVATRPNHPSAQRFADIDYVEFLARRDKALYDATLFEIIRHFDLINTRAKTFKSIREPLLDTLADLKELGGGAIMPLHWASHFGALKAVDGLLARGVDPDSAVLVVNFTPLMAAAESGREAVVARLIKAQASVDQARTDNGVTALMAAAYNGHEAVVARLIEAQASVNQARIDGGTALMVAAQNGHEAVVARLIKAQASVDQARTDNGVTALILAAQNGHETVAARLIEAQASVDQARTDNGVTALMMAAQDGHEAVVAQLIEARASVNQVTTNDGNTALMVAAQNGHEAVVARLIEARASVNQVTTDNGATALMLAALKGNEAVVARLIEARASVNQVTTDNGATALMLAALKGNEAVVARLIEARASVNQVTTDNGVTALMVAAQDGHEAVVARLIEARASVDQARTDDGATALMVAAQNGHRAVVAQLIEARASVDQTRTDNGATALMLAALKGHEAVVARLIEARASVDQARTDDGATALMLAAHNGHGAVVARLIEAQASVDQTRTDYGITALIMAAHNGHMSILNQLVAAGAYIDLSVARRNSDIATLSVILVASGIAPYKAFPQQLLPIVQAQPGQLHFSTQKPPLPLEWRLAEDDEKKDALTKINKALYSIYDFQKSAVFQINHMYIAPAPFYRNFAIAHLPLSTTNAKVCFLNVLIGRGGAILLNGQAETIHLLNRFVEISNLEITAESYLRFFCQFVRVDEGPFEIIETPDQIPWCDDASASERRRIGDMISPVQRLDDDAEGRIQFSATVLCADTLFRGSFAIALNGEVKMLSVEGLAVKLPVLRRKYDGPLVGPLGSWEP